METEPEKKERPVIACDFDGTLVNHAYPDIGEPIEYAVQCMKYFSTIGCKNILWTCRNGIQLVQAIAWVYDNEIEFLKFNQNIDDIGFYPMPKIYADFYIDDRNIGFKSMTTAEYWNLIIKDVHGWIKARTGEDLSMDR